MLFTYDRNVNKGTINMSLKKIVMATACLAMLAPAAQARKEYDSHPIADLANHAEYQRVSKGVRLVWGNTPPASNLGTTRTRKATKGLRRTDREACEWAMMSAIDAITNQARRSGATSIQGLKSVTDSGEFVSASEYKCVSGWTNSRVSIIGTMVK